MSVEQEIDYIKDELKSIKKDVEQIRAKQASYVEAHHTLEKEMVELKSDIKYIKSGQDSLNNNINKVLFIVGGGFITAAVMWVIRGGMS